MMTSLPSTLGRPRCWSRPKSISREVQLIRSLLSAVTAARKTSRTSTSPKWQTVQEWCSKLSDKLYGQFCDELCTSVELRSSLFGSLQRRLQFFACDLGAQFNPFSCFG